MFNPITHTVPVVNFDRREPDIIGSGILLAVDDLRFVFTAAHVLEGGVRNVGFGARKGEDFVVFGDPEMRILTATAEDHPGDAQRAEYKDGLDFSVMEIEEELQKDFAEKGYEFFDLRLNTQLEDPWFIVTGWPARANLFKRRTKSAKFKGCFVIQAPKEEPEGGVENEISFELAMNRRKDFVEDETSRKVELPKLEGISGGGVWTMRLEDNARYPDCAVSLAGMIVAANDRRATIIRAKHFWNPLIAWWGVEPS